MTLISFHSHAPSGAALTGVAPLPGAVPVWPGAGSVANVGAGTGDAALFASLLPIPAVLGASPGMSRQEDAGGGKTLPASSGNDDPTSDGLLAPWMMTSFWQTVPLAAAPAPGATNGGASTDLAVGERLTSDVYATRGAGAPVAAAPALPSPAVADEVDIGAVATAPAIVTPLPVADTVQQPAATRALAVPTALATGKASLLASVALPAGEVTAMRSPDAAATPARPDVSTALVEPLESVGVRAAELPIMRSVDASSVSMPPELPTSPVDNAVTGQTVVTTAVRPSLDTTPAPEASVPPAAPEAQRQISSVAVHAADPPVPISDTASLPPMAAVTMPAQAQVDAEPLARPAVMLAPAQQPQAASLTVQQVEPGADTVAPAVTRPQLSRSRQFDPIVSPLAVVPVRLPQQASVTIDIPVSGMRGVAPSQPLSAMNSVPPQPLAVAASIAVPPLVSPAAQATAPVPVSAGAAPDAQAPAVTPLASPAAQAAAPVPVSAGVAPVGQAPVVATPQPQPLAPTVPAIAPAAQVFAAAIHQAVRDELRIEPNGPALAPLGAMPADLSTGSAAGAGAVVMTNNDWPMKMIGRIEMLRDALDAADTSIRLIPDKLGAIDVSLRRDGDAVTVQMTAQAPETRQLLAEAQPKLVELAEARGLKLSAQLGEGSGTGQHQHQQQRASPGAPSTIKGSASAATSGDAAASDERIA
jgi:Meckel syndrome type 1 protein